MNRFDRWQSMNRSSSPSLSRKRFLLVNRNDEIASFDVSFAPLPSRIRALARAALPFKSRVNQIRVSKEMDCVIVFNSDASDASDASASDREPSSSVLVYTSLLSLRAVIQSPSVKDCFITRAGILLIGPKKITKVDFVGRVEAEMLLDQEPFILSIALKNRVCGDVADLILALVEADGTILLIDSITTQILTRIPTEKAITRILFDTDSTGIFAYSKDGNGFYYPLNNSLSPAFLDTENTSAGENMKMKIWSIFAWFVCWISLLVCDWIRF